MASVIRRGRPLLTTLPGNDPVRATRDLLRKSTEKFFLPFVHEKRSSPDLASYRFKENLSNVLVPAIIDTSTKLTSGSRTASDSSAGQNCSHSSVNDPSAVTGPRGKGAHRKGNFLCAAQLNGEVGSSRIFEDLFHVILSGFDVVHVNVENKDGCSLMSCMQDPCHFRGFLILAHTRPFLGWQPSFISMPRDVFTTELDPSHPRARAAEHLSHFQLHTHDILPFATVTEQVVLLPKTVKVPFSVHAEGSFTKGRSNFLLSHLNLRLRFVDALCANPAERDTFGVDGNRLDVPPETVVQALKDKQTLALFAGLRRLGVRPELITADTLLAATEQKAAWTDALGLM